MKFGADVNAQNRRRETVLHLAARQENRAAVEYLILIARADVHLDSDIGPALAFPLVKEVVAQK